MEGVRGTSVGRPTKGLHSVFYEACLNMSPEPRPSNCPDRTGMILVPSLRMTNEGQRHHPAMQTMTCSVSTTTGVVSRTAIST